jgi:RNA polymerase sigma-70 factor (ECF subfamily)
LKVALLKGHASTVGVTQAETADEQRLVRAAQGGDDSAFRALYERHFELVFRSCRRLGLLEADAEDAAQETFVVAARKLFAFSEGKLSTWLYRIAANLVSARHRSRRLREGLAAIWGRSEEPHAPSAERDYEAREASRRVVEVLARMAPKKREVFALFELEGLTGEEVAERVGCKVDTVWTRLWHARRDFERIARKRGWAE